MGGRGSKLSFGGGKVAPLQFQPKAKDESNKLRRKNSLYDEIILYLDLMDKGDEGAKEIVDRAYLASQTNKDKSEAVDDPRIQGMNKTADEIRDGNFRTLRNQVGASCLNVRCWVICSHGCAGLTSARFFWAPIRRGRI